MIVIDSDCCNCGLPCLYEGCTYYKIARFFCDDCDSEENLWYFEGQQLCADCILKRLEEVSYNN